MTSSLEKRVSEHYGRTGILDGILSALAAAGHDVARLKFENMLSNLRGGRIEPHMLLAKRL